MRVDDPKTFSEYYDREQQRDEDNAYYRARYSKFREQGLCTRCPNPTKEACCPECKAKLKANRVARQQKKAAAD